MTWHDNTLAHDESDAIPTGWHEVPVQKLIVKHICGPSPDCDERPIQTEQEWGVLKTTAIVWKGWNESAHKTLPREYWGLEHLQVQQGDVLITKAGPRDRVAVVVHVTSKPRRIIVSGKMIALRPRPDAVVPQVLCGVLGLRRIQDYIHGRTTGMAESQVNFANGVVLDANVRVPVEIAEQSRIAEILDTLDAAIRETEAVVAKLRQVKAGLLHDLLTRGLDEHGQLRHPEQFQDSPLGRIPKDWDIVPLGQTFDMQLGKMMSKDAKRGRRPLPYLGNRGVQWEHADLSAMEFMDFTEEEEVKFRLLPGDVLVCEGGEVGRAAIWQGELDRCCFQKALHRLRPKTQDTLAEFLLMFMRRAVDLGLLQNYTSQTSIAHLTQEKFAMVPFLSPKPDEQRAISKTFREWNTRISTQEAELSKLHCLKRGLSHDLLTGRVRVKLEPQP